jgi:hypothetical protein
MANQTTEIIRILFDADEAIKKTADLKTQRTELKDINKALATSEKENAVEIAKNEAIIKALNDQITRQQKETQLLVQANIAAENSYEQLYRQQQLAEIQLKNQTNLLQKNADGTITFTQAYFDASKNVDIAKQALLGFNSGISQGNTNVGNYANTIEGMRARLEELRKGLQSIDVNTEEFQKGSDEAANLALKIDQVTGKVDEFGNKEPKNPAKRAFEDTIATAGAFASAMELASLTADENGEVNESVAKSLKSIAVAQQVANILKEKGAIIDTLTLKNFRSLAIVQSTYAAVVGTSTGALKLFRLALVSTGIGAIVVAVGLLISNFEKITNVVSNAARSIGEFFGVEMGMSAEQMAQTDQRINQLSEQDEKNKKVSDSAIKGIDREIEIQKSLGKNVVDLEIKKQKQIIATAQASLQSARAQIKLLNSLGNLTEEQTKKYNDAMKAIDGNKELIADAQKNITVIENNETTKRSDAAKKDADERQKIIKQANEKAKAERQKYNEDIKSLENEFLSTEREKLIKQYQDKINLIKINSVDEAMLVEEIKTKQAEALDKFDKEQKLKIIDDEEKFAQEIIDLTITNEEERARVKAETTLRFAEARLEADMKLITADENITAEEKKQLDLRKAQVEKAKSDLAIINQEAAIKVLTDQASLNDQLLQNELSAVENSVGTEEEKTRRKAEINLKYLQDQLTNAEALAIADKNLTDSEIANIEKIKLAVQKAQQEIADGQKENPIKNIGELLGASPDEAEELTKNIEVAVEQFEKVIGIVNERYNKEKQNIEETQKAEIDAIQNSTLSEEEKKNKIEELNKNAARKKYEIEVKQFKADKALKLILAAIDVAASIIKASPNIPLMATAGAIGAVQVAIIGASQPPSPPRFASGIVGLKGAGNSTSDSIPAMLSNGESVITASGTRYAEINYPGLLQFLNRKNKFADGVVNFNNTMQRNELSTIGDQLRFALQDLTIVTKITDIEKSSNDRQSVRRVGII